MIRDSGETRWWWIRHAPVPGHAGRMYGQTDLPCDTSDSEAIAALAGRLPRGAVWVLSTLRRTHETAQALAAAGADMGEPIREADLAEQAFGTWQGMNWDEIRAAFPDDHGRFWRTPMRSRPPEGESFADQFERVRRTVERLTADFQGRDLVAVSHAGTIRAALALALNLDLDHALALRFDNLSLTRIDHVPRLGEQGHLAPWRVVTVNRPPA